MNLYWTALLLGLLGSLHCLGMCGPLALALPGQSAARGRFVTGRIIYNSGRVITYTCMGIFSGLVGAVVRWAGWQQGLSIAVGVGILVAMFLGYRLLRQPWAWLGRLQAPWAKLKIALAARMKNPSLPSLFGIGLLNGLLPCGLVYVALAAAATTGSTPQAMLYMAFFGLGTFPMMLAATLFAPIVQATFRIRMQRAIPVALATLAALFILRGLSLGIPYISPDLSSETPACCSGN